MTTALASSVSRLLDTLAGETRGVYMRVERTDGTTLEGYFEQRKTPTAFMLLVVATQEYVEIPYDDVRHIWLPRPMRRRYLLYLTAASVLAALVGLVSVRMTDSAATPGVLLGIATWLAIMLGAWLPAARNWIVPWALGYRR